MFFFKVNESARSGTSALLLNALDFAFAFEFVFFFLFFFVIFSLFFFLRCGCRWFKIFSLSWCWFFNFIFSLIFLLFLFFFNLFLKFSLLFVLFLNLLFSIVLFDLPAISCTPTTIFKALNFTSAISFDLLRLLCQCFDCFISHFPCFIESFGQHPGISSLISGYFSSLKFFFHFISCSDSPWKAMVIDSNSIFIFWVNFIFDFVLLDNFTIFDFCSVKISLKKFEFSF